MWHMIKVYTIWCLVITFILSFCITKITHATYISGHGDIGAFTGDFNYDIINDSEAIISIDLENTSNRYGYLTGLAFLFPTELIVTNFNSDGSNKFKQLSSPINVQPFGKDWGLGASTFKSWEGGGKPSYGIATNNSTNFTFSIFGDVNDYNEQYFINNNSFVTRFRGFTGGGSDKVSGGGAQVPEPITLVLMGTGLLYLSIRRRKHNGNNR